MKQHASSQNATKVLFCVIVCSLVVLLSSCVQQSRKSVQKNQTQETSQPQNSARININIATKEELAKLPAIGEEMAERIIEHRNRYGRFQRVEHILLVRGMSDKKFRSIENLITVE